MLIGFKRQFAPFVLDGTKTHTIRAIRKIAPKVGETCHCYVDPRQKTMRLLGRWPCVRVETIEIGFRLARLEYAHEKGFRFPFDPSDYFVRMAGELLTYDERDLLAWRDGFRHPALFERDGTPSRQGLGYGGCFQMMMEFWKGRLPFEGQIIHWNWTPADSNCCERPAEERLSGSASHVGRFFRSRVDG